jgi:tripartite ATP-independent transporter DctM subunit
MDALLLLFSFLLLMAIGMPVAYAMGLATLITALWVVDIPLEAIMLKISDGMDDFALLTIPFFVLAGAIMSEGGVARRLVDLAKVFVGFIRGGLAVVNVLASTLFGCLSGSSVADTASIGSVMIPQMVKNGYSKVFATNVTICGSVQAILTPPSHNSIIYSIATGGTVSIAALFMAGVFPALLFGACLIGLVLITARRRGYPASEPIPLKQAVKIALDAVWGLITIVIILGGILSGAFTAVESGAVACVYALFCTMVIYKEYKWSELPKLIHRVTKTVAMVMMVIGFAAGFGYLMAIMQLPAKATALFLSITNDKYAMLMMINILLLLLGTFMDMAPMILICTPILLPIVKMLGVDPVHFGMIMLLNLGIGLITPPVGSTLFVGCAIGKVTMEEVSRELWPFYGAMCIALLIVTYVPQLSLWLPRTLGY